MRCHTSVMPMHIGISPERLTPTKAADFYNKLDSCGSSKSWICLNVYIVCCPTSLYWDIG